MIKRIFSRLSKRTKALSTVRVVEARNDVSYMIDALTKALQTLQTSPNPDMLSVQGYYNLIQNIQNYRNEINNGPSDINPLWGIIGRFTSFFDKQEIEDIMALAETILE